MASPSSAPPKIPAGRRSQVVLAWLIGFLKFWPEPEPGLAIVAPLPLPKSPLALGAGVNDDTSHRASEPCPYFRSTTSKTTGRVCEFGRGNRETLIPTSLAYEK